MKANKSYKEGQKTNENENENEWGATMNKPTYRGFLQPIDFRRSLAVLALLGLAACARGHESMAQRPRVRNHPWGSPTNDLRLDRGWPRGANPTTRLIVPVVG